MRHIKPFIQKEEKVIFLMFIINYNISKEDWINCVNTFNNLDVDWWVEPKGASHLGFAKQSILNTSNIEEAKEIAEYIESQFKQPTLICLSKQLVTNTEPVSNSNDECWVNFGRTFDKMVSNKQTGIFVL